MPETERPLTVLHGKDHTAIEILIDIHSEVVTDPVILDCTYNQGTMWRHCRYQPTFTSDISEQHKVSVVADFARLPFGDGVFDVIIFDPPHLPTAAASANSSLIWERRYGITAAGEGREGDSVTPMFLGFIEEARRTLRRDGIVLAKIADITHNHKYQWQMVEFVNAARVSGMTPCDMLIKMDPSQGNLRSSKWMSVRHLRKGHSYWIVLRNSARCERKRS